ncbi:hypothetical protein F4778DRAFT_537992 [Xylariomycetidae sp. FL2044]|nr:hypothetical protein F4778DRAFT_537992 [Xylariomycetidae sp. FL2044]
MGCGTTRKLAEIRPEQKWDAISLKDFKSTSCFTPMAYGYLYISLIISVTVYGVDTFTAVNLLAFNKWSSSIEPTQLVPFDVSKWVFSICIIASFVNLAFEHVVAMRVMKRKSVAECYLNPLAVRLESTRLGEGQGWRRFLVFAELTKSKKGAEYVALFTYFSFHSWIRVIFCSGPRQAINAMTLYAVYTSDLIPTDVSDVGSTLGSFFGKIETLAKENSQQAVILSGMLFTLIVWVFSALFLLAGVLFYIFFLWHYIPSQDGGLHGYCERKINKRLMTIVTAKVNKALEKEERQRIKAEFKAAKKAGEKPPTERQATLPKFLDDDTNDKLPDMPMLGRSETMATLPVYTSRPGTPSGIEMSAMDQKRPLPSRQETTMSSSTYSSRAPLIGGAAGMGFDRSASLAPSLPNVDFGDFQPPARPGTAGSNRSFGPGPQLGRIQTNTSGFGAQYSSSPSTYSSNGLPAMPQPVRSPAPTMDSYNRPMPRAVNQLSGRPGYPGRPTYDDGASMRDGRSSPAPSVYSNRGPPSGPNFNGPPFSPLRSATNPMPSPQTQQFQPQRNMTAPMPPRPVDDYYQRPGTASSQRSMRPGNAFQGDPEGQRDYPRY